MCLINILLTSASAQSTSFVCRGSQLLAHNTFETFSCILFHLPDPTKSSMNSLSHTTLAFPYAKQIKRNDSVYNTLIRDQNNRL